METFKSMLVTGVECPKCGSKMYTSGSDVWCVIAAGGDLHACDFNHDHKITLEQFLLDK